MPLQIALAAVSLIFLVITMTASISTKHTFWLILSLLWAGILGLGIAGLFVAMVEHH